MAQIVTINNNVISSGDIRGLPIIRNRVEYDQKLIASEADIIIDNTDDSYSDTNPISIFYGVDWLDKAITVYDDIQEIYTWVGRLKNLVFDHGNRTVKVKTANYVSNLSDVTCVYSASGITPAEAIYDILVDVIGVSTSYINNSSFTDAINMQTAASATIDITFTAEKNTNCLSVVQELMKLSQCVVFTIDNIINCWQWRVYSGAKGYTIKGSDYIPGTLVTDYDTTIYNAYAIKYNNSGTVASATGTQASTDGDKCYTVPNESIESTTPTDYTILATTQTAADWFGAQVLARYQYPSKLCTLQLDYTQNFLKPNDQIDLVVGGYYHEPVRLVETQIDHNNHKISCKGIYLNLPHNYVTRDTEPPDAVQLIDVTGLESGIRARWTVCTESDHLGYYVYVAAGETGEWSTELTNYGKSPVDVKTTSIDGDGYCYIDIYELSSGATYYARVTAYDTSYNESEPSNTLSCTTL